MMLLAKVGGPVVHILTALTNLIMRMFGIKGEAEPNLTEDEIKALISQGAETGAVGATEENIVQRVFQLGDQRVAAIMTPRPDIEWIDVDAGEEELREFLASHAHTMFVVCHGGLDEVLGIARSADLLQLALKGLRLDLRSRTRDASSGICCPATRSPTSLPRMAHAIERWWRLRPRARHGERGSRIPRRSSAPNSCGRAVKRWRRRSPTR